MSRGGGAPLPEGCLLPYMALCPTWGEQWWHRRCHAHSLLARHSCVYVCLQVLAVLGRVDTLGADVGALLVGGTRGTWCACRGGAGVLHAVELVSPVQAF